eukprot:TRINITY_DN65_c0_g2_i3.p1 TRINITY_DN65_c0_g2~~TRINITY_DN65_c0_g2_i3.p1  ORF type:complete len:171 (-),score=46.71 TRINITY_DN65_c0_g2_i3:6-452(-)
MADLARRRQVCALYKKSLKTLMDWVVEREIFNTEALKIRDRFRAGMKETDPAKIAALISQAETELASKAHPNPLYSPHLSRWLQVHEVPHFPRLVRQGSLEVRNTYFLRSNCGQKFILLFFTKKKTKKNNAVSDSQGLRLPTDDNKGK